MGKRRAKEQRQQQQRNRDKEKNKSVAAAKVIAQVATVESQVPATVQSEVESKSDWSNDQSSSHEDRELIVEFDTSPISIDCSEPGCVDTREQLRVIQDELSSSQQRCSSLEIINQSLNQSIDQSININNKLQHRVDEQNDLVASQSDQIALLKSHIEQLHTQLHENESR